MDMHVTYDFGFWYGFSQFAIIAVPVIIFVMIMAGHHIQQQQQDDSEKDS